MALLIEREEGAGPYVESTAERFRVVASGEAIKSSSVIDTGPEVTGSSCDIAFDSL